MNRSPVAPNSVFEAVHVSALLLDNDIQKVPPPPCSQLLPAHSVLTRLRPLRVLLPPGGADQSQGDHHGVQQQRGRSVRPDSLDQTGHRELDQPARADRSVQKLRLLCYELIPVTMTDEAVGCRSAHTWFCSLYEPSNFWWSQSHYATQDLLVFKLSHR